MREREPPVVRERDLRIQGSVVVVGAADTLHEDLSERPVRPRERVIVADGALTGLLEHDITPHLVVSDLDGDMHRLMALNLDRVPVAVHAHGDNMGRLRQWVPELPGILMGTRQNPGPAPSDILNPGGFGDGDRAVFLAARLGADRIRLVGFDLHGEPGRLSHHTDPVRKKKKMAWSARILADAHRLGIPLEEREGRGV
ncbi:MAG: DUF115 domain-containing protein [Euryarchaeota archaeon]|nr:DUF115 domain-containing protein [Euryarchaeota archaeon]